MNEAPSYSPTREGKGGRSVWLDGLLVFVLAYGFLALLPDCFDLFDEALVASISERLLGGEVLYRDLFIYWTPGVFWFQQWVFEIAGVSVAAVRIPFLLCAALISVGVWRLCAGQCARTTAILAGLGTPLVCIPVWWMSSPHWYATLASVLATLGVWGCLAPGPHVVRLLLSGALCGISFLLLQPVGAAISCALGFALVWDRFWLASPREAAQQLGLLALGALLPILGTLGYFTWKAALAAMFYDTFLWNFRNFAPSMEIEYGSAVWMPIDLAFRWTRFFLMGLPPLLALSALWLSGSRYLSGTPDPRDRQLFVLAAFAAALLVSNSYYPDVVHLAFGAPPAFALLGALGSRIGTLESSDSLKRAGAGFFLLFLLFVGSATYERKHTQCDTEVTTRRGIVTMGAQLAPDFEKLFAFLDEELGPQESFYVYPYGPGLNFLSGHPNAVPLEGVIPHKPGYFSESQLASVVAALEEEEIPLVVLSHVFGPDYLYRHRTEVERYIRNNYRHGPRFGQMRVLKRKPETSGRTTSGDPPRR